jgi:deoxyribose-phosphate aldolase
LLPEQLNHSIAEPNPALALQILGLIDLTSLNETDTVESIQALCRKAITPVGSVAAVCVYPQFIRLAATELAGTAVKLAAVANFPHGSDALLAVLASIQQSLDDGANEIDVVLPYQHYLAGEYAAVNHFIQQCKRQCGDTVLLKVILETGILSNPQIIASASRDVLVAGADFIKTSTGKILQGASLPAATAMLEAIKAAQPALTRQLGLKISGGVRTLAQANDYIHLADQIMGQGWVSPQTFRFGASQLLDAVLSVKN